MPPILVRREKSCIFSGCESRPATIVLAGSNRSGDGGNKIVEAFGEKGSRRRLREQAGRNLSERWTTLRAVLPKLRPSIETSHALAGVRKLAEVHDRGCPRNYWSICRGCVMTLVFGWAVTNRKRHAMWAFANT
jgi:hypothetical protein